MSPAIRVDRSSSAEASAVPARSSFSIARRLSERGVRSTRRPGLPISWNFFGQRRRNGARMLGVLRATKGPAPDGDELSDVEVMRAAAGEREAWRALVECYQ